MICLCIKRVILVKNISREIIISVEWGLIFYLTQSSGFAWLVSGTDTLEESTML